MRAMDVARLLAIYSGIEADGGLRNGTARPALFQQELPWKGHAMPERDTHDDQIDFLREVLEPIRNARRAADATLLGDVVDRIEARIKTLKDSDSSDGEASTIPTNSGGALESTQLKKGRGATSRTPASQ